MLDSKCKRCQLFQEKIERQKIVQSNPSVYKKTKAIENPGLMEILVTGLSMRYLSGQPLYCYELCLELRKRGHNVMMAANWAFPDYVEQQIELQNNLEEAGVKCIELGELMKQKQRKFDLIIASETVSEQIVKDNPETPVINVIHSEYDFETPMVADNIIYYVCVREAIKKHIVSEHQIPEEKCIVIYNGIDFSRFYPREKKERNYYKVVIPATTDTLREKFLNHFINKANKYYRVFIYGAKCSAKLEKNDFVYVLKPKFNIEEEIADADEVPGILFGRVNIEAMACGIKTTIFDPYTLESEELTPPKDFQKIFDIKNMTDRILQLVQPLDLTIVIPHHNRHDHLKNILEDLDKIGDFKIHIIKGGSFGDNCNLGAKLADTDWICLLNDDTRITDRQIFKDMIFSGGDIVGCDMEPSTNGCYFDERGEWQPCYHGGERKPDYPSGACLMIRRAVFEELGGFDNIFITGDEDLDLFLRAEEKGYKIKIVKNLITHYELQSDGRLANCEKNIRAFNKKWKPKYWQRIN